jgi:MFS family permease
VILQQGLSDALETPAARTAILVIGLLLVGVLLHQARRIPGKLLVLMGTAFLDMAGMLMIVPLLPFYVRDLAGDGLDLFGLQIGVATINSVVIAAFTVAQLLSAPLWGRFSDRFGRRPALLVSLAASCVAYLVFAFADSLWLLLVARVVQGAGGGTVGVIQAYVADSTEPSQRTRALGWLSAATNLGVALGPLIGIWAVPLGEHDLWPGSGELRLGTAAPGICAAAMCLITMAFAVRFLHESNTERNPSNRRRVSSWSAVLGVLRRIELPSSRLILTYGIAMGAFQGINSVLALFLAARHGIDKSDIGYFYMFIGSISVFTRTLLLGRMVDTLGEARLSRVGIMLLSGGVLLLPMAETLPTLALCIMLLPLGTAFTFPCVTAMLSRVVDREHRGLYMGLQQTYGGVGRIAMPLVYGWAFDTLGIGVPFYISATLVLCTLLLGRGLAALPRHSDA